MILILSVALSYVPVWKAGFIWDDNVILTINPCIVGPLGLKEIWASKAADICPLTLTTFWVEHAFWGLNPTSLSPSECFTAGTERGTAVAGFKMFSA